MAQSIGQAQAAALADGFLGTIGTARPGEFVADASLTALIKLAGDLIINAQNNLRESNQVSSGALSDSFKVINPKGTPNAITLDIEALHYFDFQNKGVRGIRGGASQNNYSFKNDTPSKDMVKAITEWMKRSGMSTSIVPKEHGIKGHEAKQKAISEINTAYGIARNIKIKGIKGSGYLDKAIKIAQTYASEVLGKALAIDIIQTLPKTLSGLTQQGPTLRQSINNGNSNQ